MNQQMTDQKQAAEIEATAEIMYGEYRAGWCSCPDDPRFCGYHVLAHSADDDYERRYVAYRTMALTSGADDDYDLHASAEAWALGGLDAVPTPDYAGASRRHKRPASMAEHMLSGLADAFTAEMEVR